MPRSTKDFDRLPRALRWAIALLALPAAAWPLLELVEAGYSSPAWYLLFPVVLPLGQFGVSPIFRELGVYRYYSPMLLGMLPNQRQIDLHSGGSFDDLFRLVTQGSPRSWRRWIQHHHINGLLALTGRIECGDIPDNVVVTGSTYFISERSARRLGFSISPASAFDNLNLWMNVIDITWMYSVARGRWSFPPVWRSRRFTISGRDLFEHRHVLKRMLTRLGGA
jgi:hypothetical protein